MKLIQLGSQHFCLRIYIRPVGKSVFGIYIYEDRMRVAEKLIKSLVEKYGKHSVYTDGGI